ncbi:L,D-transpeptidase family protein [Aquibium oceanicum]|uniref:L,D-TPase catalytic domain-containing protein n=1 Tax=Aquibium oceanicum TaxID=1670800 RepID=A0A1L3SX60_9HYPH|nr:L,D-transpeptidase [Aquibium oceanicum]APH73895.1 hypothetical protein BSQ44_22840 [Aquibium oceanicum]
MTGRNLILSAAAGLLAAGTVSIAAAAVGPAESGDATNSPAAGSRPQLLLAQNGEVDIFFDARGRRVILDARTGEVIAIEEPGARQRQWPQYDRLYESGVLSARPGDPDVAAERYRRYREYQLGLREAPDEAVVEDGFQRYPQDDRIERRGLPEYGEVPEYEDVPEYREPPEYARGEPLERAPLPTDPFAENPVTGSTPGVGEEIQPAPPRQPAGEDVAELQILLDRAGLSPGVIDGKMGGNVQKALDAYTEMTGKRLDVSDPQMIADWLVDTGGDAFTTYTITPEDAAGPYVASVPADYGDKAKLEQLSFTSTAEMLAERFHMDENYLKSINPGADFSRPGTQVKVANPGSPKAAEVERIVADKGREQVRAYDRQGNLVAAYPATIGSTDMPSPSGTVTVERIAFDPEYTYNPKINFKQGDNDKVLRIPPGPNGPVGSMWIALSKPTYGIHGTPEPSKIGKTNSHGCVRLTNWDARELAKMVKPGIFVQFID